MTPRSRGAVHLALGKPPINAPQLDLSQRRRLGRSQQFAIRAAYRAISNYGMPDDPLSLKSHDLNSSFHLEFLQVQSSNCVFYERCFYSLA